MARSYWLVKQEPTFYPFSQLQKDKKTARLQREATHSGRK